jgi:hypothetical protein
MTPEPVAHGDSPFTAPRQVTDIGTCLFHHTIDLPGHGTVPGGWDLRAGLDAYLGHVSVAGKRVLDLGTTSGYLTFAMESRGAEVVSYDYGDGAIWDLVPFPTLEHGVMAPEIRNHLGHLENAYWFAHAALGSRARLAHGSLYDVPAAIGPVDIAVLGTVLLRLRDPFRALHSVLKLTRETVVVTEVLPKSLHFLRFWPRALGLPMFLLPRSAETLRLDSWWIAAPATVQELLRILGFGESVVTFHHQSLHGRKRLLYTVVARRTAPTNPGL